MATYADNLRYAGAPARWDDGSVHLPCSAKAAMVSALFGMREAFRAAQRVDQIGFELDPADAAALYNDLRSSIGLLAKALPPRGNSGGGPTTGGRSKPSRRCC